MTTEQGDLSEAKDPEETSGTERCGVHQSLRVSSFNRLGLTQWDGIEEDIAWGHVTSLMGLARPCIDGPIFIDRAQCRLEEQSPTRVQLMATTGLGPEPLLAAIASHFTDLADPAQCEPWRLIAIDTSRGRSRNRELHYPCQKKYKNEGKNIKTYT